jgi:hypothetical protein
MKDNQMIIIMDMMKSMTMMAEMKIRSNFQAQHHSFL